MTYALMTLIEHLHDSWWNLAQYSIYGLSEVSALNFTKPSKDPILSARNPKTLNPGPTLYLPKLTRHDDELKSTRQHSHVMLPELDLASRLSLWIFEAVVNTLSETCDASACRCDIWTYSNPEIRSPFTVSADKGTAQSQYNNAR